METFSALLAICAGNSPVTGEFPVQRPVKRSFDVFFFAMHLNKRLNKQSWGCWFKTPSRPLSRHYYGIGIIILWRMDASAHHPDTTTAPSRVKDQAPSKLRSYKIEWDIS